MTHLRRRDLLLWPLAAGLLPAARADDADLHAWLESVEDPQALAWVQARNAEALAWVAREPDFARRRRETLAALTSSSNVSVVARRGEYLYNFYRNTRRPLGVWRRTTLQEYAKERPSWQTLLEVETLARDEQRSLVFEGANVHAASERALLYFSAAGEDKVEMREFDIAGRAFVAGGFATPRAKQRFTWHGPDELLIATDTGPDSVTTSGYARQLRRWKRGTPLASAPVLLECEPAQMMVYATSRDTEGMPPAALLHKRVRFFETERMLLVGDASPVPVDTPRDGNAWLEGEWLTMALVGAWSSGGRTYPAGSVLALPIAQATQERREIHVLLEGRDGRRVSRVEQVKDGFVLSYTDDLRQRLVFLRREAGSLRPVALPVPEFGAVTLRADRPTRDNRFWLTTQSPLWPQVYALVDADRPQQHVVEKSQPPAFDASGLEVRQHQARSADGTLVPYTVIGPVASDKTLPTLLYGYGGFGLTVDLEYQRRAGINWLQYGGVMVLAHIRGGGEFGPAWKNAGKGTQRQNGFDDFIAVAQDLVARGVTTPRQLGIYGASNGGALVTAVMVQRPELFGAVVSRVPLTDMLGYTRLFAGASWIEEYGDPAQPAERAVLARWSPYHNVRKAEGGRRYPPILFIGNRNDDRVHPAHARKMVAQLRSAGHERAWLYEESIGGHSGRSNHEIHALREALVYSFLRLQLAGSAQP